MKKTTAYLLRLVAVLVLVLGQQSPAASAARHAEGEEPPDARHSGLDLGDRLPGALAPEAAAEPSATTALAAWTQVVFQSYRDGNWEIYRADGDGNYQGRLTYDGAADIQPRLNRGNTQIVFASSRTGNYEIFRMNGNGTGVTQLTDHSANDTNPAWSPDGSRIAFQSFRDGNWEVYVMNADGSGLTRLTNDGDYDAEPAWSPDGTRLAFVSRRTGGYRVYVMSADGAGPTQLSDQAYSTAPAWSPDGNQIVYSNDYNGDGWYDLWRMSADGSSQIEVLPGNSYDHIDVIARSWSPDGRYIAYTSVKWVFYNNQFYWVTAYPEYRDQTNGNIQRFSGLGQDWEPDWQGSDLLPPTSRASALNAWTVGNTVMVQWSGTDTGPAGVGGYDVQSRTGLAGPWVDWLKNTPNTSGSFQGAVGDTYFFRVRAHDQNYNWEAYPSVADAATTMFAYMLAGSVYNNREQPVIVASVSPAPSALAGAVSQPDGAYQLHLAVSGPYIVTATRSGFGSLPGLRNAAPNSLNVNFYLPPADDRVVNGGLETGSLGPWVSTGELTPAVSSLAHTGLGGVQLGNGPDQFSSIYASDPSAPQFELMWGSGGSGNGQFNTPVSVATHPAGDYVYVSDRFNHRIQKFTSAGEFVMSFGTWGSGNGQLIYPIGLVVDPGGSVYVADWGNGRIQRFTDSGGYLAQWVGQYNALQGIAMDSAGNLIVLDVGNQRVQKYSSNGDILLQFGSYGRSNGHFVHPQMVALDAADNIFVVDQQADRVQKFDSAGNFILTWGSTGSGTNQFINPAGIATDTYDNVYVADTGNNRIVKFDGSGNYITQFGLFGTGNGQFNHPQSVEVDAYNNIYVLDTDNSRVQKFSQPWLPPIAGLPTFYGSDAVLPAGGVVAAEPVTLMIPPGGVSTTSTFTIMSGNNTPALPAGLRRAGLPFTVMAVSASAIPLTQTEAAMTVTLSYADAAWQQGNIGSEATLQLWQYDAGLAAWQPLSGTLDTVNNLVAATTTRLGLFALLGTGHVGPWVNAMEQAISLGASLAPSTTLSLMYNVSAINAVSDSVRVQLIGPSQTYTYTLSGATLAAGAGSWKHAWWAVPAWADASVTVRIELFEADRSTPTIVTFDEISLGAAAPGGYAIRIPVSFNTFP